jgi:hypothetical protein
MVTSNPSRIEGLKSSMQKEYSNKYWKASSIAIVDVSLIGISNLRTYFLMTIIMSKS